MKRTLFFLVLGLLLGTGAKGQIKIGDNPQTIDPSSVLELESGSRVLVVTRVSTAEMNAITPLPGAVVYNTDLQCVHYYNGTEWINICEEVGGIPNLTTEPFVNTRSTIVITTDGENNHIEVAPGSIGPTQIAAVRGDQIQPGTVRTENLNNGAVTSSKIFENAVGVQALNNVEVEAYLEDHFTNTVGYITNADIISTDPDNDLTDVDGAFYDEQPVLDAIQVNTDAIAVNAGAITTNANAINANTTAIGTNAGNITANTSAISANTTAIDTKEDAANKSDDVALGNSADLFPTQNAVKTYVDNATGAVSTLNNGEIYVGNGSNVATSVAMSGDATIDNTGVITIENDAITTAKILNGQVTNAKIAANTINSNRILNGTIQEIDIADAAVTPIKIEPSPTNGRYLSTNASGVVEWVDLPAATVNTDNQQLTLASDVLTLEDGGTPISLASYLDNTDEQQLSISGNRISLTDGGFVDLPPGTVDTDEQQLTLEPGNLLTLEDGGTPINLTPFLNTDEQTISDFTFDDTTNILTLTIDNGGTETANLSSLAGGTPTAADVTFSATGNTTSGNVQAAIVELQNDIDGFSAVSGQSNTASNVGFAGEGLFLQKTGVDLEFKNINAASNKVSITNDAANNEVDIDIVEGNLTITESQISDLAHTPAATAVTFAPTGNTTSNNVQDAIVEIQSELDGVSIGEANTVSNQGTAGEGLFIQKTGSDLEFKNINAASNKVSVTNDAANNEVDIDIVEGNLTITESQISDLAHTVDTQIDAAGITALGFVAGPHTTNTDNQNAAAVPYDNTITSLLTATTTQAAIDELATTTSSSNLENSDLIQSDAIRNYNLNNGQLRFNGVGNVRIGTSTTVNSNKLHVEGTIRTEGILNSDGASDGSEPSYRFSDDTNTGMWSPAADEIGFSAGGFEAMRIEEDSDETNVIIYESLQLDNLLLDKDGDSGTASQILSSTGTQTDWVTPDIVAKGRVTTGGTGGSYTETVAGGIPLNAIINLTVEQSGTGNPIMIQLVSQTLTDFTVQIYEWTSGSFTGTNSNWNYTIVNP